MQVHTYLIYAAEGCTIAMVSPICQKLKIQKNCHTKILDRTMITVSKKSKKVKNQCISSYLNSILFMGDDWGKGQILNFLVLQKSYQAAILSSIRRAICSLPNFGPLLKPFGTV